MFENGFGGFKFGFPGMGGMDDGMETESNKEKDTKLYEILGVEPNCPQDEIKKAFRKKAMKMHPDKGGNPEQFKDLSMANEILSNPEKRDLYDKYGMDGVKDGGGPQHGDIFDLFGMGGGGRKKQGAQKAKPQLKEIHVTLDEVYHGKTHNLKINRKRCCVECDGKGGKDIKTCDKCKGKGVIEKMVMLGPGMYSHSQQPCTQCRGEGKILEEKNKCKTCKGAKVREEKKTLQVSIEPGVPHEYDYILHGESDEMPGIMAGDIYGRILIDNHKIFKRKGADLYMDKKISLLEALVGFTFELDHIDKSKYIISAAPGEVITHGQVKTCGGKGMPYWKDVMSHGNLHITFSVEFPKKNSLKPNQVEELRKILPGPKSSLPKNNDNLEYLKDFDESDLNVNAEGGRKKQYDDDDEYGHQGAGGQRVQCNQQ